MTGRGAVAGMTAKPFILLVSAFLAVAPVPVLGGGVAAPDGYRMAVYRAPTPDALPGAVTVDAAAVAALAGAGAVLVDVVPAGVTRLGGAADWVLKEEHRTLPGSVWLPNVGEGRLAPEVEGWYRSWLDRLTGGDRTRPLVIYCKADCWLSWNAARRALAFGHTAVHWYRDGVDGWEESGRPLVVARPAGPPPGARVQE